MVWVPVMNDGVRKLAKTIIPKSIGCYRCRHKRGEGFCTSVTCAQILSAFEGFLVEAKLGATTTLSFSSHVVFI